MSNGTMKGRAGVWIDHQQAVVVFLHDGLATLKVITGDVEGKHKSTGGTRSSNAFSHRSVESANRQDLRRRAEIHRFFADVIAAIRTQEIVVLMGPSTAKGEFAEQLAHGGPAIPQVCAILTTTSNMTQPQIVALVREQFGEEAPRRHIKSAGLPS